VHRDLPTGTVTFLFTDVEGSTRLLHELGAEEYAAALAEHRQVIRRAGAAHGGVEVDAQGDSLFAAFPTAAGAVSAAAEITRATGAVAITVSESTGTVRLFQNGEVKLRIEPFRRAMKWIDFDTEPTTPGGDDKE